MANPLDESDESDDVAKSEVAGVEEQPAAVVEKAADAPAEQQEATPDVTKDPEPPKPVKKAKKPKKMPPWLNKPKDGDGDSDSKGSDDKDDDDSSCKSAHAWEIADPAIGSVECSKCHTTPAQAAGVAGTHDMTCAPVPELMESDGPASTKGATPASASGAVGESMTPFPAHREPDGAPMEAFEADARHVRRRQHEGRRPPGPGPGPGSGRAAAVQGDRHRRGPRPPPRPDLPRVPPGAGREVPPVRRPRHADRLRRVDAEDPPRRGGPARGGAGDAGRLAGREPAEGRGPGRPEPVAAGAPQGVPGREPRPGVLSDSGVRVAAAVQPAGADGRAGGERRGLRRAELVPAGRHLRAERALVRPAPA